jgi:hypothetical protein
MNESIPLWPGQVALAEWCERISLGHVRILSSGR